jgi:AICAR transformylase/IMP cyclohydrolase PurH (only IMP cyclohydrolase domain in Aful)
MGIDVDFGSAFAKSQMAAYSGGLPSRGTVFVSVADRDKRSLIFPAKRLVDLGFDIVATEGTAEVLHRHGIASSTLRKLRDGEGPRGERTTVQAILAGDIDLIINTPFGVGPRLDGYEIRTAAVLTGTACITTIQGLSATVLGIEALVDDRIGVRSLQEHSADLQRLRQAAFADDQKDTDADPVSKRGRVVSTRRAVPRADAHAGSILKRPSRATPRVAIA